MRTTERNRSGRARRWLGAAALAVVTLTACSAGASDTRDAGLDELGRLGAGAAVAEPAPAGKRAPDTARPATVPAAAPTTARATTVPEPLPRIMVAVDVGPSTTVLAADVDPDMVPGDPFEEFTACSGLDDAVGAWTLQLSQPDSELSAVGIMTTAPVDGPGVFEATFRLEWFNGGALDAHGLVTLDPGLQSGRFASDDFDVSGSFRCEGSDAPEALGDDAVEVYALMQRGTEQRIVSVAAPAGAVACPAVPGPLELVATAAWGTITRFRIGPDDLAIAIGDHELDLDAAAVETSPGPGVGTFRAETVDGTVIDGAYRCAS